MSTATTSHGLPGVLWGIIFPSAAFAENKDL